MLIEDPEQARPVSWRYPVNTFYPCSVRLRDLGAALRRQEGVRRLPEGLHQHQGRPRRNGARKVGF